MAFALHFSGAGGLKAMTSHRNRFKRHMYLITTMMLVGAGLAARSSARMMSEPSSWEADPISRRSNAKELLGRSYERSPANVSGHESRLGHFVLERTRELLPENFKSQGALVAHAILQESRRFKLDPILTMAVIAHESKFRPEILGSHGEIGLMQIKPDTAKWIAKKYSIATRDVARDLKDPVFNVRVGTAYISMLRQKFSAHGSYYLAAYNMGSRKLIRTVRHKVMPHDYASGVMREYLGFYRSYRARALSSAALAQNI